MSEEQAPYKVSYIASAPEEFNVGDWVEVIDAPELFIFNIGRKGVITALDKDGNAYISVKDDDPGTITAPPKYLRKLPDTISFEEKNNPLEKQVGGNHYKDMAIQPVEFIYANGLDFISGNICKYAARHRNKNGAQDVEKIIHYAKLLLKIEYGYSNEQISQI